MPEAEARADWLDKSATGVARTYEGDGPGEFGASHSRQMRRQGHLFLMQAANSQKPPAVQAAAASPQPFLRSDHEGEETAHWGLSWPGPLTCPLNSGPP